MKMISIKKITGLCVATAMIGAAITPTFASVFVSQNRGTKQIIINDGQNVSIVRKDSSNKDEEKNKIVIDDGKDLILKRSEKLKKYVQDRADEIKKQVESDISENAYSVRIEITNDGNKKTEVTTKAKTETTTKAKVETTTETTTAANVETTTEATTEKEYSDFVTAVLELTNAARAENNLPALELSDDLCKAAQDHANDMSANKYFSHTSQDGRTLVDRVQKYNTSFYYMGENIARGQSTAEEVVNDWLNSEGHRANIMNTSYTKIGIGYCNGYWVQDFAE